MSKNDCDLIANVIANMQMTYVDQIVVALAFADRLTKDDPAFDWSRFMRACGVVDGDAAALRKGQGK